MKTRIKSMIWNVKNQKTTNQNNKVKKIHTNEDSVSSLWDNIRQSNALIIGVPEEKGKSKKSEIYLKKMKENFPNVKEETSKSRKHNESQTR